jgi:triosephosphate isomerase
MAITNVKPFIAGNWKMHKNIDEAIQLVSSLKEAEKELSDAAVVVIPPFTTLREVKKTLEGSSIKLGAQNLFWEEKGAFTGEISPLMLKDTGCEFVVLGHSERRQYFGETDVTVNKKIRAALAQGLVPIVCIGESLEEREKGETMNKVEIQLRGDLEGLGEKDLSQIIIAYEPIWAIGTGLTATPAQAEEVHSFIRGKLEENYGNEIGSCVIILYGGSVKPDNTYSLLKEKNINGALVGGASLKADSFIQIAKEGIKAYKEKT